MDGDSGNVPEEWNPSSWPFPGPVVELEHPLPLEWGDLEFITLTHWPHGPDPLNSLMVSLCVHLIVLKEIIIFKLCNA